MNLRILRRLIWCRNPGEVGDHARARLLVQALRIALLGYLDGDVDEYLNEGDFGIGAAFLLLSV